MGVEKVLFFRFCLKTNYRKFDNCKFFIGFNQFATFIF